MNRRPARTSCATAPPGQRGGCLGALDELRPAWAMRMRDPHAMRPHLFERYSIARRRARGVRGLPGRNDSDRLNAVKHGSDRAQVLQQGVQDAQSFPKKADILGGGSGPGGWDYGRENEWGAVNALATHGDMGDGCRICPMSSGWQPNQPAWQNSPSTRAFSCAGETSVRGSLSRYFLVS
jgi:hypothetical protein